MEKAIQSTPAGQDQQDWILIQRTKLGDHEAFEAIFRRYSNKVFQLAYRFLKNKDETEDVLQEVFLALYQKARTFRGRSQFSTWLYRLTVNATLTRLRRQKRRKEVPYENYLPRFQKDGHHQVRPVVDWSNEIDERLSREELREILNQALDQLRPPDKAVVILSDFEGFSDREISQALGLSISAVKTRLHRARLFLRGKLAVHLGYSPT